MKRTPARIRQSMEAAERRITALDHKIGQLMSRRVDNEEYIAECMDELARKEQNT